MFKNDIKNPPNVLWNILYSLQFCLMMENNIPMWKLIWKWKTSERVGWVLCFRNLRISGPRQRTRSHFGELLISNSLVIIYSIIEFWNLVKNTFIVRDFARLISVIRISRCWSTHFYPYFKNYVHGGTVCVSCACAYFFFKGTLHKILSGTYTWLYWIKKS